MEKQSTHFEKQKSETQYKLIYIRLVILGIILQVWEKYIYNQDFHIK